MATTKSYNDDKQKQAYEYFLSKGYSKEAAIGIVGNLMYESRLNPTAEGDKGYEGGSSEGIAQFRLDRLKLLKKRYGKDWTNFNNQLEFVDWELNNTHRKAGDKLRKTNDIHTAGQIFSDDYEIPKKKYHQNEGRRNQVSLIASRLTGYTPEYKTATTKNINSEETFLQPSVELPTFATLPQAQEETKSEKKVTAEEKLEEKQNEKNFLDFLSKNRQQEVAQQVQPYAQAPQLDAMDFYNQANQVVGAAEYQQGGVIKDNRGQWAHPGKVTEISSPNITMQGVNYPVLGVADTGERKMMMPNLNYYFNGASKVTEYPMMQEGGEFVEVDNGDGTVRTINVDLN